MSRGLAESSVGAEGCRLGCCVSVRPQRSPLRPPAGLQAAAAARLSPAPRGSGTEGTSRAVCARPTQWGASRLVCRSPCNGSPVRPGPCAAIAACPAGLRSSLRLQHRHVGTRPAGSSPSSRQQREPGSQWPQAEWAPPQPPRQESISQRGALCLEEASPQEPCSLRPSLRPPNTPSPFPAPVEPTWEPGPRRRRVRALEPVAVFILFYFL